MKNQISTNLKKGDQVVVITGKDRGKKGRVLKMIPKGNAVLIEGVNMVKRHTRPSQSNQMGGIVEKEAGIHLSNLMPLTPSGRPTRVQFVDRDGKKVRYSTKHEEYLDE